MRFNLNELHCGIRYVRTLCSFLIDKLSNVRDLGSNLIVGRLVHQILTTLRGN